LRTLGSASAGDGSAPIATALGLAAGAALLLGALGMSRPWLAIPLALFGILLGISRLRRLTPPGTLVAQRGLPAAVAFRGLSTFSFFGADAFLAFALANVRGLSPIQIGLALTPSTITWTLGAWVQARQAGRWSRRALATTGLACCTSAIAIASLVLVEAAPLSAAVFAWALAGLGMGLSFSPTAMVAFSEAEPGRQGAATSAMQLTDVLGAALGTGSAGAIIAMAPSLEWSRRAALAIVFALMFAVSLLAVVIARRFPPDPARLQNDEV
jgi:MFS family permease